MVAWTAIAFKSIQRCLIRFSLRSSLGSLRTITELSLGYSSLRFCNLEQVLIKEIFHILCSAGLQTRPFTFSVLLKNHPHLTMHLPAPGQTMSRARFSPDIMLKQFNIGFILAKNLVSSQSASTLVALFANSKRDFICFSPRRGFHLVPLAINPHSDVSPSKVSSMSTQDLCVSGSNCSVLLGDHSLGRISFLTKLV